MTISLTELTKDSTNPNGFIDNNKVPLDFEYYL